LITIILFSLTLNDSHAVDQTIGLLKNNENAFEGYTLFSPMQSTTTYLIDNYGRTVHFWESDYPVDLSCYLLENGNLLRTAKITADIGGIQEFTWDGTLIWEYSYTTDDYLRHHDIAPLPNGNVLILAREYKTTSEAYQAGRDPDLLTTNILWTEFIVEVEPTGFNTADIVWEWHIWDHLIQDFDPNMDNYGVVQDHSGLLDINFIYSTVREWLHANAIDYNAEFDQIILNSRKLSEFWVIDHSTTSAEAASHNGGTYGMGGDFLYRWGNPEIYDAGDENDRKFFEQHDARWIENDRPGAGNILVYNNGNRRPGGNYSTVDEIIPPVDENGIYTQPAIGSAFLPNAQEWIYSGGASNSFYSVNISGAHRLSNGNTLICIGKTGHFVEVTPTFEIVWEYLNPLADGVPLAQGSAPPTINSSVFRCCKHSPNFGVLPEKDLLPCCYLEVNPITFCGTLHSPLQPTSSEEVIVTSKISDESGINFVDLIVFIEGDSTVIQMFDDGLNYDEIAGDFIYTAAIPPQIANTTVSYYLSAEDGSLTSFNDPPFASNTYNFHYTVNPAGTINQIQNVNIIVGINNITLNWDSVAGATNYRIYVSDNPYDNFVLTDTVTEITWSELIFDTKRFYRITASDE